LLRHLWSLAVEEQFYVAFPLLLIPALRAARGRTGRLAVAAISIGAASTALMATLWVAGDPSRAFYGTDTRAVGLCAGVALGFVLPLIDWGKGGRIIGLVVDAGGLLGLGALALLMTRVDEFDTMLYHGGFAMAAAAAAIVVAVVIHPRSRLGRVLGCQPFRWIGTRSYAIYLWDWPVLMLTRPRLDTG